MTLLALAITNLAIEDHFNFQFREIQTKQIVPCILMSSHHYIVAHALWQGGINLQINGVAALCYTSWKVWFDLNSQHLIPHNKLLKHRSLNDA